MSFLPFLLAPLNRFHFDDPMRRLLVSSISRFQTAVVLLIACLVIGNNTTEAQQSVEKVEILGGISEGVSPPPKPPKVLPDLPVVREISHIGKGRMIRMKRVEDPGYPEPESTPMVQTQDDEEAFWLSHSVERKAEIEAMNNALVFSLSATVVDHRATRLRWIHEGKIYEAWSNVDFNHLTGFTRFKVDGRYYDPYFGIGNTSSEMEGVEKAPDFPTREPTFILTRGDAGNAAALEGVEALHALYRVERGRLKAAYEKRELARLKRQRYLEANPPKPEDVTIQFWKREPPDKATGEETR